MHFLFSKNTLFITLLTVAMASHSATGFAADPETLKLLRATCLSTRDSYATSLEQMKQKRDASLAQSKIKEFQENLLYPAMDSAAMDFRDLVKEFAPKISADTKKIVTSYIEIEAALRKSKFSEDVTHSMLIKLRKTVSEQLTISLSKDFGVEAKYSENGYNGYIAFLGYSGIDEGGHPHGFFIQINPSYASLHDGENNELLTFAFMSRYIESRDRYGNVTGFSIEYRYNPWRNTFYGVPKSREPADIEAVIDSEEYQIAKQRRTNAEYAYDRLNRRSYVWYPKSNDNAVETYNRNHERLEKAIAELEATCADVGKTLGITGD